LIEQLKKQHANLGQDLIDLTQLAWEDYLKEKVLKRIPEQELSAQPAHLIGQWKYVEARVSDPNWLAVALQRDEKFSMHVATLVGITPARFECTNLFAGKIFRCY
jgi:hypothetical protein